jgi:hypothetical protein
MPDLTEAPTPNHELFVRVLAQIEKHPETWQQDRYVPYDTADEEEITVDSCGTGMCFAGWACLLVEGRHANAERMYGWEDTVPSRALRHLGLYDTDGLFVSVNTLRDLYRISADILGLDETVLRDKVTAEVAA